MFGKSPGQELPVPSAVEKDSKSFEILRIWIAGGGQHVCLKSLVWDDPAAWGLMLADVARHAANSYARDAGRDASEVLKRIKQGFDVEMSSPTDSSTENPN